MTAKELVEELDSLKLQVETLPNEAAPEVAALKERIAQLEDQLSTTTTSAWGEVQLSRHPERPYFLDYVPHLFDSFRQIHGDRKFADDPALVGGFALLDGQPVMVIGQQKGRDTKERLFRNYGMSKPEGYRKAHRLMLLAEKFGRPVLTFIDTPGAYPGIGAEERGQAEAIALNLRTMAALTVPVIATVLGEGGSGGALGIGVGDRVLMLEHSIYSVISPESCSAILWKDQEHVQEAAETLRLTAGHLFEFGIIDEIVPEPRGGAHRNREQAASLLLQSLAPHLREIQALDACQRLDLRFQKFRRLGEYLE